MAETDTRLETLEDEVKVLKGEVKRTLVDLRALLMREDSPLGEAALAKRMARGEPGGAGEGSRGLPTRGLAEVAGGVAVMPAVSVVYPDPLESPGAGGPAQMAEAAEGPGAGPGPGVMPASPTDAAPGPPPAGSAGVLGQPVAEGGGGPSGKEAPRPPVEAEAKREEDQAGGGERRPLEEAETVLAGPPSGGGNGRSRLVERQREGREGVEKAPAGAEGKRGPVTSIYDEYQELLEETGPAAAVEDGPVGPPLDVNLLSNLVYWAALAKQRVGEEQLKEILQLYIQSGHSRPELQDLLLRICAMVEGDPEEEEEGGGDWVDLMFHLHGILTGGLPVAKIPQVRLPLGGGTEEEEES